MFVMFVTVNVFIINKGRSSSTAEAAVVSVGICAHISILWETMFS